MRWWNPAIFIFVAMVTHVSGDIFSSTAHLQHLLHLERHLVTILHNYMESTERKLNYVRGYLDSFYQSYNQILHENVPLSSDDMVGNPLQAFHLVKRLSVDWNLLQKVMDINDWFPVEKLANEYKALMPRDEDLHGAALALVRLQDTYKLNMSDMARGDILGMQSGIGLTARDLLYLGKQSFNMGYYGHSIQWLEQALTQAQLEGNRTASVNEILAFHQSAIEVHDKLFERTDIDLANYDTLGHPVSSSGDTIRVIPSEQKKPKLGLNNSLMEDQHNYMALCRGEKLRSPLEESKLKCTYVTQNNPFLILQPAKMEQHSFRPYIVQFHGLLTDKEVEVMREIAEPKLSRSMVQASAGSEIVSHSRTSQNAWVGPKDHPLMDRAYKLVEAVTGLSTDVAQEYAEMVQIANYGMGGHYTPHYDYLLVDKTPEEMELIHPKEIEAGDRTATLMFYLSDVTRGGATVFPKIGAGVWPQKGSAVFWYNLKVNGGEDELTLHGACPVLHGSKWVANFWIREKGQMFRRRCDLDPNL